MTESNKNKNAVVYHQILATVPLFLVEFMIGIGLGWLAPTLPYLKDSPHIAFTAENCAWIASLHYSSRAVTALLAIFLIGRLGRSPFLVIASVVSFIMWVIVYWSVNVYVHYIVRLLFGIIAGLNDIVLSFYLGESCSAKLRGIVSGLCFACFYFGQIVEYLLAAFLSYEWLAMINATFGFLAVLSTLWMKESNYRLIMKQKIMSTPKNYVWLHDMLRPKSRCAFDDVQQYVLEEKGPIFSRKILRCKGVVESVKIVTLTQVFSYLGGYSAITAFITMAMEGSKGLSSTRLTLIFGVILSLAVLSSTPFMEKFNGRTLLLFTFIVIVVIHTTTATLHYLETIYRVPHFHWIFLALLTTCMNAQDMCIFPLMTVVRGEVLPHDIKGIESSLAVVGGSVGGLILSKIFLSISNTFGMYTNYIVFSFISVIMFLYVYLPEIRGKTLIDTQRGLRASDTNASS